MVAVGTLLFAACLSDPLGPNSTLVIKPIDFSPDTVFVGAPGKPLSSAIHLRAVDGGGHPVAGAVVRWSIIGDGASVTPTAPWTDAEGDLGAVWTLGVRANQPQGLIVEVQTERHRDTLTLSGIAVPSEVAAVSIGHDTLHLRLGERAQPKVVATDSFGNLFVPVAVPLRTLDPDVAAVDSSGAVVGLRRGSTHLVAGRGGVTTRDTGFVQVIQVAESLSVGCDSVILTALGQSDTLPVTVWDDLAQPVVDTQPVATIADTSVANLVSVTPLILRSGSNGRTTLHLQAGSAVLEIPIVVAQVERSISVQLPAGILDAMQDSQLPVACQVLDGNGASMNVIPAVAPSAVGRWTGQHCDELRLRSSGVDTLRVSYGSVTTELPVALAVRPIVGAVTPLVIDQLPAHTFVWATSARRNSQGRIELYFTAYTTIADSTGHYPGDLHRLVSDDGLNFTYDGLVLSHDPDSCDLNGSGIENIDIVPRADGPGWRMFYAGGSFDCYGWQVFSAVSTDERTWTKEPGIRISNGGSLPPDPPTTPLYPAGEGMTTDQLSDGTWRMTVGTYEPLTPPEDKFQITEWRSPDQLRWTYVRSLVTTRQLPSDGQRSAYSPTVNEVAPGLWRMIFTADDRDQPNGRSRLWSAVSTDRVTWQVEGEILGAPGVEYFYSALVGDRLFTIQAPQASSWATSLVGLTLQQP